MMLSFITALGFAIGSFAATPQNNNSDYLKAEREKRAALELLSDCMVSAQPRRIEKIILADPKSGEFEKWADGHPAECYLHVMKDFGFGIDPTGAALQYALAEAVFRRGFRSSNLMRYSQDLSNLPPLSQGIPNYRWHAGGNLTPAEADEVRVNNERALYFSVLAECVVRDDPAHVYDLLSSKAWSSEEDRIFGLLSGSISACVDKSRTISIDRQNLRGALALNYLRLAHERPQQPFLKPGFEP